MKHPELKPKRSKKKKAAAASASSEPSSDEDLTVPSTASTDVLFATSFTTQNTVEDDNQRLTSTNVAEAFTVVDVTGADIAPKINRDTANKDESDEILSDTSVSIVDRDKSYNNTALTSILDANSDALSDVSDMDNDTADFDIGHYSEDFDEPRVYPSTFSTVEMTLNCVVQPTIDTSSAYVASSSTGRSWLDWIVDSECSHHMH